MEQLERNASIIRGSPRVSPGSHLIFALHYINDLPDSLQSQVRLFADDTAVYLTVQGQVDSKKLKRILMYCKNWKRSGTWNSIHLSVRSCTSPGPSDLSKLLTPYMARFLSLWIVLDTWV